MLNISLRNQNLYRKIVHTKIQDPTRSNTNQPRNAATGKTVHFFTQKCKICTCEKKSTKGAESRHHKSETSNKLKKFVCAFFFFNVFNTITQSAYLGLWLCVYGHYGSPLFSILLILMIFSSFQFISFHFLFFVVEGKSWPN